MAITSYTVEFHNSEGRATSVRGRSEQGGLTRQRAHELALKYVKVYPDRAAIIYIEVEKKNGVNRHGRDKFASRSDTVARVAGKAFRPKRIRSTMETKGRFADAEMIRA